MVRHPPAIRVSVRSATAGHGDQFEDDAGDRAGPAVFVVVPVIRGVPGVAVVEDEGSAGHPTAQLSTASWRRLLAWRPAREPDAALSRRWVVSGRDAAQFARAAFVIEDDIASGPWRRHEHGITGTAGGEGQDEHRSKGEGAAHTAFLGARWIAKIRTHQDMVGSRGKGLVRYRARDSAHAADAPLSGSTLGPVCAS